MKKIALIFMLLYVVSIPVKATASDKSSSWHYNESQSLMDDSKMMNLSIRTVDIVNPWPNIERNPSLIIQYKEGSLDALLELGIQPESSNGKVCTLKVRFDSNNAYEINARISPDKKSLFIVNSKPFIRELSNSSQLLVQFTNKNGSDSILKFDTRGLVDYTPKLFSEANFDLNDKNSAFEDYYYSELSNTFTTTVMNLEVNKNAIKIKVHGNDWQSYARNSSVKDLLNSSLSLIDVVALKINKNYRLKVNIYGSTVMKKKQEDGGRPFKSSELQSLFQKAISNRDDIKKRVYYGKLKDLPPKYYGKDSPDILLGTIQEYNDSIEILIEL